MEEDVDVDDDDEVVVEENRAVAVDGGMFEWMILEVVEEWKILHILSWRVRRFLILSQWVPLVRVECIHVALILP